MSAHRFLSDALSSTLHTLGGGESLIIRSHTVPAILDPTIEEEDLDLGGQGDNRSLTLLVHTAQLPATPTKGEQVTARGQQWTINQIEHGPFSTRLTLHSPSRRYL